MTCKMIQVGTGGHGKAWCREFLPPNVADGLIEVVAAVDVDASALQNAHDFLGLPRSRLYTDLRKALEENPADFLTIVIPPAFHEEVVDAALEHDLHILSEKPIADTLEGSVRIADKVKKAGKKMGVTMSHRFDRDKTTLREELRSGRWGNLDYIVCRFTCDCRKYGSWGAAFRHEIPDSLMIEGAVHHLDILADLAEAICESIYAETWNPSWGEFKGDSQGLVTMRFANGKRATYEGAKTNAVGFNGWEEEYLRAECERGTLVLNRRRLESFPYNPGNTWNQGTEGHGNEIPLLDQPKWANTWLVEKFVHWLERDEPMETNVEDNLQSMALVFSAIESSRTRQSVNVQKLLKEARDEHPVR